LIDRIGGSSGRAGIVPARATGMDRDSTQGVGLPVIRARGCRADHDATGWGAGR
jgi:hypothetical protein